MKIEKNTKIGEIVEKAGAGFRHDQFLAAD